MQFVCSLSMNIEVLEMQQDNIYFFINEPIAHCSLLCDIAWVLSYEINKIIWITRAKHD